VFEDKISRRDFFKLCGSFAIGFVLWSMGLRFLGNNPNAKNQTSLEPVTTSYYEAYATPVPEIRWARFRDKITIDPAFVADMAEDIAFKDIPDGSILLLAARTINLEPSYTLNCRFGERRYHLIVVADRFDARGGKIDAKGMDGNVGRAGSPGRDGHLEAGNVGSQGEPGGPGQNGMDVTLMCQRLGGLDIVSNGGRGGRGGDGGAGGAGDVRLENENFCPDPPRPDEPCDPGELVVRQAWDGGAGGTGGTGGRGGNSGRIVLTYIQDDVPNRSGTLFDSIVAVAGDGGDSGPGGAGGRGGYYAGQQYANDGPAGPNGSRGENGSSFAPSIEKVDMETFWNRVRSTIGTSFAEQWANYRLKVGSYYYRKFKPDHADFQKLVIGELQSVNALSPANQEAPRLMGQILANQNIFGMPYDYDIFPDFRYYEETVRGYIPIITNYFDFVIQMLAETRNTNRDAANLRIAIDSAERNRNTLELEKQRAETGLAVAQKDLDLANQRVKNNEALILTEEQKLRSQEFNFLDFVGTAWDIGRLIVQFSTVVGSVAAIPELFHKLGPLIVGGGWSRTGVDLLGVIDWKNRKLKPEAEKFKGGLEAIWKEGKILVERAQALRDIFQASPPDGKTRELLLQSAELAFAQGKAQLLKAQAELEVQIMNSKIANLNADIERTRSQEQLLAGEVAQLGQVARSYLQIARNYADLLMKLMFMGARALDIYTLLRRSIELSYDYGYIEPDIEAIVFEQLGRARGSGDLDHTKGVINLMQLYKSSISGMGIQLSYAHEYASYNALPGWDEDIIFKIEDSAEQIQQFKDTMRYRFSISLENDEAPNAFESKIEAVTIGLIGARSRVNNIACNIEHSGEWSARRYENGEIVKVIGPPKRSDRLQASISQEQFDDRLAEDIEDLPPSFWGRGPSTEWLLYLDPQRMQTDQVDLSGLTEVRIAIRYRAIFQSA
jgi:hypothetical protein